MEENKKDQVEFTINGNPGQGNTFINIHKAGVVNNNPGTVNTTINVNSIGDDLADTPEVDGESQNTPKVSGSSIRELLKQGLIDRAQIQKEIMKYVDAIRPYVKEDMDKLYLRLWARIMEHRDFSLDLYDPGNQPCKFNRYLVGNIMHYLDEKEFYAEPYNQSEMTRAVAKKFNGADNKGVDDPARRGLREDLEKKYADVIDSILNELAEK